METLNMIRDMLATIAPGEIFTTRQMLRFGHRRKVDLILHRLVKEGRIRRLSYGVFCRAKDILVSPTVQDVATIKMKGHEVRAVDEIKATDVQSAKLTFFSEHSSGAFLFLGEKVTLKKICARKYKLSQSEIGRVLLRIWLTGRRNVSIDMVRQEIDNLNQQDKVKLRSYLPWIPGWLHNHLMAELDRMNF